MRVIEAACSPTHEKPLHHEGRTAVVHHSCYSALQHTELCSATHLLVHARGHVSGLQFFSNGSMHDLDQKLQSTCQSQFLHVTLLLNCSRLGKCSQCTSLLNADEGTVQNARSRAAAAGVPSSEPMTLQELEAVQHKMAAKLKQPKSFTSGEQFLDVAQSSTQQSHDDAVTGQPALLSMMANRVIAIGV